MDTFALLGQGLLTAMQPMYLLYALIGVTLGTAVGVLPGIGPALTVALLLPVAYQLDATGSPMSSTKTSPPSPMAPAWMTS